MVETIWEVEFTDEFEEWWDALTVAAQESVGAKVQMLEVLGPSLGYPHSTSIKGSRYPLRELRVQHQGDPLRILYIFDPRRTALLLLGGDKTGDDRWYDKFVPLAEKMYLSHLEILKAEN
ncbi:MAG: type II toxin-antitoxin system RelE/ParE family toxin [Deltaproteobacteria bacterium]|jgi:hypothetical protein|nr:type II toxin-antitoxin system RelE/ParE family toxin [Deltaproteobacteria bacterium]